MQLSPITYLIWSTSSFLTLLVCVGAYYRKLFAYLPIFTTYLTVLVFREIFLWCLYLGFGYTSRTAWYYYWDSQILLLLGRGGAIAELAWRVLREYRGIWGLSWRLLAFVALVLVGVAVGSAWGNTDWGGNFILTLERGLEFAAAGVLLTLLFVSGYYGIRLQPIQRSVAVGLCFYSAFQVFNNAFIQQGVSNHLELGNNFRMVSFILVLGLWVTALRKPLPVPRPAPSLFSQQVYDEISPEVNYRLRALNQRLIEILGP